MPTLHWIGKDKVVSHHLDVPYRVLNHKYGFKDGKQDMEETESGNMIIQGDNLEALKALLPKYQGRIKCIYIDPPYNTGNEGWVYNDNVNDPKIKKWLGDVVGPEGEDLSRHDKWLCMMYPRLKLLYKLLRDDGVIFISIDDNESAYVKMVLDEIFGGKNFIQQIIWKNKYGPGAMTKGFGNIHEYIFCYSKKPITSIEANLTEAEISQYKYKDEHFKIRGGYITQPLATKSKDDRPNLVYPLMHNGIEIWPDKQWIWSKERMQMAYEKGWLQINEKDGKYSVRFKQYLYGENGQMRKAKPISILTGPYNQDGTSEMVDLFGLKIFDNPKPASLLEYLSSMIINEQDDKDGIYLDSFAGSGTTAHAVLNLNKQDGGNRKFILVELGDYADSITAERNKRVIQGYGETKGTGGAFDFYELGAPLFKDAENLNEDVGEEKIREYVWYTETQEPIQNTKSTNKYFLGTNNATDYYFFYEKDQMTTLDYAFLATVEKKPESLIIYADKCTLSEKYLREHGITFKKIPRDISKI